MGSNPTSSVFIITAIYMVAVFLSPFTSINFINFLYNEAPSVDANNPNWIKKTNTLDTQTGFYEIFSINLTNYYRNFWYDAPILDYVPENIGKQPEAKASQLLYPIAVYRAQPDGYEDAAEGVYPLQYVNIHPHHRVHSQRTDNKGLLEIFDDVLFINPISAEELKTGDTVILTSSNGGKIMRRVLLLDTVMPGVIIAYGAPSFDKDELKTDKCDFYRELVGIGEAPVCVTACSMNAIDFGDLELLKSKYPNAVRQLYPLATGKDTEPSLLITLHRHSRGAESDSTARIANMPEELQGAES